MTNKNKNDAKKKIMYNQTQIFQNSSTSQPHNFIIIIIICCSSLGLKVKWGLIYRYFL